MREREKELSGFITNLLGLEIVVECGKDGTTSTFCSEPGYHPGGYAFFSGKLEPVGEVYGRLNGCFMLFHPQNYLTHEEIDIVRSIVQIDPRRGKDSDKDYYIVSRQMAAIAVAKKWRDLDNLLVPAGTAHTDENVCQGFIPVSLLVNPGTAPV